MSATDATNEQVNGGSNETASPKPANKDAPSTVQPSPWQPPAEVDPVPPPVEGGETRNDSDGPG